MPAKPKVRKKQLGKVTYSGQHKGTFVVSEAQLQQIQAGKRKDIVESWFDNKKKTKMYRLIDFRHKLGKISGRKQ